MNLEVSLGDCFVAIMRLLCHRGDCFVAIKSYLIHKLTGEGRFVLATINI